MRYGNPRSSLVAVSFRRYLGSDLIRDLTMRETPNRLFAAVHYVIARTEPSELGATKLNKVLWFADLQHYRRYGSSITGLEHYIRMPMGPVPDGIGAALNWLKKERKITERAAIVFTHTRREFVWLKAPDVSAFSATEIDVINDVIDALRKQPASAVSDDTHDALWEEMDNNELMSIKAASVSSRPPSSKELDWASKQVRA